MPSRRPRPTESDLRFVRGSTSCQRHARRAGCAPDAQGRVRGVLGNAAAFGSVNALARVGFPLNGGRAPHHDLLATRAPRATRRGADRGRVPGAAASGAEAGRAPEVSWVGQVAGVTGGSTFRRLEGNADRASVCAPDDAWSIVFLVIFCDRGRTISVQPGLMIGLAHDARTRRSDLRGH